MCLHFHPHASYPAPLVYKKTEEAVKLKKNHTTEKQPDKEVTQPLALN